MYKFLAGVGRCLIFSGNNLIGVGDTYTDTTFDSTIANAEVRGGPQNALFGKYFYDRNTNITITDAMFKFENIANALGVDISSGGLSVQEESLTVGAGGGSVTLTKTPVAFDGNLIGWYRLPTSENWSIGNITGNVMTISGAQANAVYCVKYYWQNTNARQIDMSVDAVPRTLHITILNDLWAGDIASDDTTEANKIGRLITDIPRLQLDGAVNLSLTSTSAANTSLTGQAMAVTSADTCEVSRTYGTMTEELFSASWQDDVVALAVANSEIELSTPATETLQVYAVFGGITASAMKPNSSFTFTSSSDSIASVSATGVVTAVGNGTAYISVSLTNYPSVNDAIVEVTVS